MTGDPRNKQEETGHPEPATGDKPLVPLPLDLYNDVSRRAFLRLAGFTFFGAMTVGCSRAPEEVAIPLSDQPEGMIAGLSRFYATTCGGCSAGCGILAGSRDGRPIKLEGNPAHPLSRGGLCAVGQASLLGVYDSRRLTAPLIAGRETGWDQIDVEIPGRLEGIRGNGGRVRYLSASMTSPTKREAVARFLGRFADGRHVIYEPCSDASILDAHEQTHGLRAMPRFHLDRCRVIVGIDADFLGTWVSPVEFTAAYVAGRRAENGIKEFSTHVQFESRLSATGTKADRRFRIAPADRGALLSHLAERVASRAGVAFPAGRSGSPPVGPAILDDVADALWANRGSSIVLSGADDVAAQKLCNFVNELLGNYGRTLDITRPGYQLQGDERALAQLLEDLESGRVDALFVDGVNPVLDLPAGDRIRAAIEKVALVVSFAPRLDETAAVAGYVCPDSHFLESWSDAESVHGVIGFTQPLVRRLGATRQVIESLDAWTGPVRSARDMVRATWNDGDWERRIHDGFAVVDSAPLSAGNFNAGAVAPVTTAASAGAESLALVLYTKAAMPNAGHAYNPWLHELPDPITKAVWDNYACLSPVTASRLGVESGDVVHIADSGDASIDIPVLVQPGQHDGVVAVAMGYGSELSRRFSTIGPEWLEARPSVGKDGLVGVSATPLLKMDGGTRRFSGAEVIVRRTGSRRLLSRTQDYHEIEVPKHLAPPGGARRPNIRETTVAALLHPRPVDPGDHERREELWADDHEYTGHHWGMTVDLSACTGCSACVIACQVENNVPVVGKDEVGRNREMHWIRIDRYYHGEGDNLDVAHQPMMCHHCDHAPCETVCPVLATVHSDEGLNQQVYNRCVGTRYCMNNCPYKVRRFNWFDYARNDRHENLALNPDVTIRSRGIMEKCSFCVQRIEERKILARQEDREVKDGEIQTACQQSCPARAISFGDMNDPESGVSQKIESARHYRLLDELNIRPTVGYLDIVRNRTSEGGGDDHGH